MPLDFGEIHIPPIAHDEFRFVHDYETRLFFHYVDLIERSAEGARVVDAITNDPRSVALAGRLLNRGGGGSSYDPKTLAIWFLWRANEVGSSQASQDLEEFLDSQQIEVVNTLWLLGVEVSGPLNIGGGFEIWPLSSMPESRDKDRWNPMRLAHDFFQTRQAPKCAIINVQHVSRDFDQSHIGSEDEYMEASRRAQVIALVLNAINGVVSLPYYSTSYPTEKTPLGPFGGSGGGSAVYDVVGWAMSKLGPEQIPTIQALLEAYDYLSSEDRLRFDTILRRLSQAKRRSEWPDKILDLSICLEMLLLSDNKNKDQLALSFRLRGAWLLGGDKSARTAIYSDLKDLYRYRCEVAHGGTLGRNKLPELKAIEAAWPRYVELAEAVLQKLLINGQPSWDSVILDAQ